jgi:E3 ubiquitin-protein ligase NEDD4
LDEAHRLSVSRFSIGFIQLVLSLLFFSGYDVNDQVIKWFWECIRSWPPERKSRLLQFATGTSRLALPSLNDRGAEMWLSRIPVNGFKDLQGSDGPRRFTVEKSGDPAQLPKSHTCFNRVCSLV